MTLLHAHAQYNYMYIVCTKYQKASVKALVRVDFPVYALIKRLQNHYLKANRNKMANFTKLSFCQKLLFWHQTSSGIRTWIRIVTGDTSKWQSFAGTCDQGSKSLALTREVNLATVLFTFSSRKDRLCKWIPISNCLGKETALVNVGISKGVLKCQSVMLSDMSNWGNDKLIRRYTGCTLQTFVKHYDSTVSPPFVQRFPL